MVHGIVLIVDYFAYVSLWHRAPLYKGILGNTESASALPHHCLDKVLASEITQGKQGEEENKK